MKRIVCIGAIAVFAVGCSTTAPPPSQVSFVGPPGYQGPEGLAFMAYKTCTLDKIGMLPRLVYKWSPENIIVKLTV